MGMQHLTLHFYRQHTALDTRRQTLQSLTFLFMDTHAKLVYIFCIHSSRGDSNTEDVFKDEQASLWSLNTAIYTAMELELYSFF